MSCERCWNLLSNRLHSLNFVQNIWGNTKLHEIYTCLCINHLLNHESNMNKVLLIESVIILLLFAWCFFFCFLWYISTMDWFELDYWNPSPHQGHIPVSLRTSLKRSWLVNSKQQPYVWESEIRCQKPRLAYFRWDHESKKNIIIANTIYCQNLLCHYMTIKL